MKKTISFLVLAICLTVVYSSTPNEPKCLASDFHKPQPNSEDFLHGHCSKWQSMSCCTKNTTIQFQTDGAWRGFNFNHCAKLSDKCRQYFERELCLYECDPYLSQWIVKDSSKKMRSERYYKIPLCESDCRSWFNACQDDYTCRDNWNTGFKWIDTRIDDLIVKSNFCPDHEPCQTFRDKFKSANNFCNKVWDQSFEVTSSPQCIKFDLQDEETNEQVSRQIYVEKYGIEDGSSKNSGSVSGIFGGAFWMGILICFVLIL
jgi:folate receptor